MILDYVSRSSRIQEALANNVIRISNNNTNFNIYQIASDYLKNNRMIFVVLPTLFDAQNYYDKLSNILDSEMVLFYPVDDMALASQFISSNEFKYERINTILNLLEDKPRIIITTANGVIYKNLRKDKWNESILELEEGKEYNINLLKKDLIKLGYVCKNTVTSTGEFSFRGSILDLYPLNYENPIRLDFFDDELETIKFFNVETQRTISKISKIQIAPLIELLYTDESAKKVIDILKSKLTNISKTEIELIYKDINKIDLRIELETIHNYIDLFDETSSILDFSNDKIVYAINADKINVLRKKTIDDIYAHYDTISFNAFRNCLTFIDEESLFEKYNVKYIDSLVDYENSLEINAEEIANFYGNYPLLVKDICKRWHNTYVILAITSHDKLKRLKEYFLEERIKYLCFLIIVLI